ncbi:MAG: zinc dependent phospholipase C family protein, partial [Acetanaerobacterium sp.]
MPAHITHSAFGEAVLKTGLCEQTLNGLAICGYELDRSAYEWGLQGPDLLFFATLAGNKKLPHCGNVMHQKNNDELFVALQEYAVSVKDTPDFKAVYSYVLGFACHYVLDKNCHPYVFSLQKRIEDEYPRLYCVHNKIESDIDSAIAFHRLGISPKRFRIPASLLDDRSIYLPIARLYSDLFEKVYDVALTPEEILSGFKGAKRYYRFIIDRAGLRFVAKAIDVLTRKRGALFHMLRVKDYDPSVMNDEHSKWYNIQRPEIKRTESFDELFDGSVPEAVELIGRIASLILNETP